MNLQPIDGTASKQEEIDLLHKVAKLFGNGTYIHDFLSESTLGWVETQLKNDFPPELYEAMIHEHNEHSKTLGKLLVEQRERKEELRKWTDLEQELHTAAITLEKHLRAVEEEQVIDVQTYRNALEETASRNDGLVAL